MGLTALVMAGGRGSRLGLPVEKPLLQVGEKAIVERVLDALKTSRKVDCIIVAVSKHTPDTADRMRTLSVKVLETPGQGYVSDLRYAVERLKLGKVLTVSADLPLITDAVIDRIVSYYEACHKPALTVAAPVELSERLGLRPEYSFEAKGRTVAPVGVNIVDGDRIDDAEMGEEVLVLEDEGLVVNVNTLEDLRVAEERLRKGKDLEGFTSYGRLPSLNDIFLRLRVLLEEAVRRNLAEGILLSGGLDTSILAATASKLAPLKAYAAALQGAPASDVQYASMMAERLGLKHLIYTFDRDELFEAIPVVVRTMRSFDPMEVRNSVTVYTALKAAREDGVGTVMTGDGCDELFAGYSYLFNLEAEKLETELRKLWSVMAFSSIPLAESLGIEARLPYLDPQLKEFAMELPAGYRVRRERRKVWGKWILRKAFEGILPDEVLWRVKTPIEYGSGTHTLPNLFNQMISDEEFEGARRRCLEKDRVTVRDKEHLFYYDLYRSSLGAPHPVDPNGRVCPKCNTNVAEKATYCRTCGAYLI